MRFRARDGTGIKKSGEVPVLKIKKGKEILPTTHDLKVMGL